MKSSSDKRVLFLSLSGIGNLVMQLSAIAAVKKAHPSWRITVCVAPRGTAELASSQPCIDEVLEMRISGSPAGLAGRVRMMFQHANNLITLRKHHFDIGIVLSPGQLFKSAAYLILSGIPVRIGNSYPFRKNKESSMFLTEAIWENPHLHDIEQNLALVASLCDNMSAVSNYEIAVPKIAAISYKLKAMTSVGIHPGSAVGFEWKRWPLDRFAEVAHMLFQKNPAIRFVIFGSHSEQFAKQELADMINQRCNYQVASTVTASLMETAAAIRRCSLFISNDSGLMHIAAAAGVPTIGLFGPTDERQTGPRGAHSVALRAPGTTSAYNTERIYNLGKEPHATMLAISPQMVLDKASEVVL